MSNNNVYLLAWRNPENNLANWQEIGKKRYLAIRRRGRFAGVQRGAKRIHVCCHMDGNWTLEQVELRDAATHYLNDNWGHEVVNVDFRWNK